MYFITLIKVKVYILYLSIVDYLVELPQNSFTLAKLLGVSSFYNSFLESWPTPLDRTGKTVSAW